MLLDLALVDREAGRKVWNGRHDTLQRPTVPLVSLDHIAVAFGHLPLLDDVSFQIEAGERVCIIGRNGTGKSTLLRILSGELPPDAGSVWLQPGVRRARLEQDVPLSADRPVFDVVSEGLGELSELVAAYQSLRHYRWSG